MQHTLTTSTLTTLGRGYEKGPAGHNLSQTEEPKMPKLLRASFSRLIRDTQFWMMVIALIIIAILDILQARSVYSEATNSIAAGYSMITGPLSVVPVIMWFAMAVFCVNFNGAEYTDGAIRNKILVGNSRASVYFALLLTGIFAILVFFAVSLIPFIVFCALQGLQLDAAEFGIYVATSVGTCVGSAFFFQMLTVLIPRLTLVCFIIAVVLLIAAGFIWDVLEEPETYVTEVYENGTYQSAQSVPNPAYVSGMQRDVYEFLLYALPTGQQVLISASMISPQMLIYMCGWCVAIGTVGVLIFRRRNLN